jgi:hypothetical protein
MSQNHFKDQAKLITVRDAEFWKAKYKMNECNTKRCGRIPGWIFYQDDPHWHL